jgi:hypothetical protein
LVGVGDVLGANVGLFDADGEFIGRAGLTMSAQWLREAIIVEMERQWPTRGGRFAMPRPPS